MWFESLLVFILLKLKKSPNISGIRVVNKKIKKNSNVLLNSLDLMKMQKANITESITKVDHF